jgi:hypothetical protein
MRVSYVPRSEAISALKSAAPEDLLLEIIERGVTVMPPLNLLTRESECPHCGMKGKVGRDFGVRVLGGTVRAQSWCRDCRKNPNRMGGKKKTAPQDAQDMVAKLKASLLKSGIRASQIRQLQKALRAKS